MENYFSSNNVRLSAHVRTLLKQFQLYVSNDTITADFFESAVVLVWFFGSLSEWLKRDESNRVYWFQTRFFIISITLLKQFQLYVSNDTITADFFESAVVLVWFFGSLSEWLKRDESNRVYWFQTRFFIISITLLKQFQLYVSNDTITADFFESAVVLVWFFGSLSEWLKRDESNRVYWFQTRFFIISITLLKQFQLYVSNDTITVDFFESAVVLVWFFGSLSEWLKRDESNRVYWFQTRFFIISIFVGCFYHKGPALSRFAVCFPPYVHECDVIFYRHRTVAFRIRRALCYA